MVAKHIGFVLGAALLAGTACSSHKEYTKQDTGTYNPTASNTSPSGQDNATGSDSLTREKDALISQADGSQLGTLRDYSGTTLTVDADAAGSTGAMTVRVDNSVPVFEGQQKVSTDALVPGSDVRVFYRTPTDGTQPQAVAIEILSTGNDSKVPGSQDDSGIQSPTPKDDSGTQNPDDSGMGQDNGSFNNDGMNNE